VLNPAEEQEEFEPALLGQGRRKERESSNLVPVS